MELYRRARGVLPSVFTFIRTVDQSFSFEALSLSFDALTLEPAEPQGPDTGEGKSPDPNLRTSVSFVDSRLSLLSFLFFFSDLLLFSGCVALDIPSSQ